VRYTSKKVMIYIMLENLLLVVVSALFTSFAPFSEVMDHSGASKAKSLMRQKVWERMLENEGFNKFVEINYPYFSAMQASCNIFSC